MRRAIRGLGFVVVAVIATVVTVVVLSGHGRSSATQVPPRVLGATIERQSTGAVASPVGPATESERTSATTLPTPAVATTVPPTTLPATTTTTASPPSTAVPAELPASSSAGAPSVATAQPASGAALIASAEALVHFDWRNALPGWTIEFEGERAGMRGATFPQSKVVQVYVRSGETVPDIAHAFAHELGHAVDVTYLDDQARSEFNQARGRPASFGWWVAPGADDFASGAGDWAECFAWMATNGVGGFYSRLGPPPSAAVMTLMTQLYQS